MNRTVESLRKRSQVFEVHAEVAVFEEAAVAIDSPLHNVHRTFGQDRSRHARHEAYNDSATPGVDFV
jgi:hypothetical protein